MTAAGGGFRAAHLLVATGRRPNLGDLGYYDPSWGQLYGYDPTDWYNYDLSGYNQYGFDFLGFDRWGYDRWGYDRWGYDRWGYNWAGCNWAGYDRNGWDRDGWDHPVAAGMAIGTAAAISFFLILGSVANAVISRSLLPSSDWWRSIRSGAIICAPNWRPTHCRWR